jgi:HEAT repeat protein
MRWAVAVAALASSSYYLYRQYLKTIVPPPPPPLESVAKPVKAPRPFLAAEQIIKIRASAQHFDPGVRWTALELLYRLGDPQAIHLLSKAVVSDPDNDVRLKAVRLLSGSLGAAPVHTLVRGLKDFDKDIRMASLEGLAVLGDPAAIPWIMETAQKDYEPEVRAAALRTIGRFQDKRQKEFEALALRLRQQYEAAVERSRRQQPQQ